MRIALALVLSGIALITLGACTSLSPVIEIPERIANATTAADQQRIADYFSRKAANFEAGAAWHEKMPYIYAGRPRGDLAGMMSHCRRLKEEFANAAKEAHALERRITSWSAESANR